jgi:hypothetical protein
MRYKVYLALSTWLRDLPKKYQASNGDCSRTVVCRTTTKKRVAELTGENLHRLNAMGLRVVTDEKWANIAKKADVVYYHVQHTKHGYVDEWAEYKSKRP